MQKIIIFCLQLIFSDSVSAQTDGKNKFIDSCVERWRITGPVKLTGYHIQHVPYRNDSFELTIIIAHQLYHIPSNLLDSLKNRGKYINNPQLHGFLKKYLVKVPSTQSLQRKVTRPSIEEDTTRYLAMNGQFLTKEEYDEVNLCLWYKAIDDANNEMDSLYREKRIKKQK